jgi:peroxiredoxin
MTKEGGIIMLKIDSPAPHFTLMSTKGEVSLDNYKGKYVVLFFYPLDFTPV